MLSSGIKDLFCVLSNSKFFNTAALQNEIFYKIVKLQKSVFLWAL